ncbi:MAG: hypothetical protein JWQ57_2316 [Mucilaginibacter sp.]|nr:hypothetical protein [Mucilaginibacter sp.]
MSSDEIKNEENATGRRKFVWGAGVLSMMAIVAGVLKLPFLSRKKILAGNLEGKTKMVKMLTEDGRLVEIDEALLTESRKKLTNSELQNWIKK